MTQVIAYLKVAWEAIRFIKHYRERQAEHERSQSRERALEREHQRLLIGAIAEQLVAIVKANQEGLLEIAKTSAKQAEVFGVWLKSFQTSPDPEPSRTLRDEDEWALEQNRLAENDPEAFMANLPPEFQVAFALSKLDAPHSGDPNPDFDREGRDIV